MGVPPSKKSPGLSLYSERCLPMVGLVRLYCFRGGVTNVFDYPRGEAKHEAKRLTQEGWTIYFTDLV